MSKYRPIDSVDTLIIHCAAVPNGRITTPEVIDSWHHDRNFKRHSDARLGEGAWEVKPYSMQQPGLRSIGYHLVIQIDGTQSPGRNINETGAHAAGFNATSIGICLIGTDKYTLEQWSALKAAVHGYKRLIPNLKIIGHRDVNPHKTCPGFDVAEWISGDMAPLEQHILKQE